MKKLLIVIVGALISTSLMAKNISVIVPFPAGGGTDRAWRLLHSLIAPDLKEDQIELVTEYRLGAGGGVGAAYVANTKNQSTNFLFTGSAVAIAAAANPGTIKYQPQDFQMLGYFGAYPMALFVPAAGPSNMKQFIQLCQSRQLNFGSNGVGSTAHLVVEAMLKKINCTATAIPYKGPPLIIPDLISNRVDFMVDFASGPVAPLVQDKKAKNIMIFGNRRISSMPDIPSSLEYNIRMHDFSTSWHVFLVNANADPDDVARVQRAVNRVLSQPNNLIKFRDLGLEGAGDRVGPNFLADNFAFYRRIFVENNLIDK
jgi:tripartite-type tricarboxylate transporter receptor subunit TctC